MTELDKRCYEIYRNGGHLAVYEFVQKIYPELLWHYCIDCGDNTPTEPVEKSCLICGSGIDLGQV